MSLPTGFVLPSLFRMSLGAGFLFVIGALWAGPTDVSGRLADRLLVGSVRVMLAVILAVYVLATLRSFSGLAVLAVLLVARVVLMRRRREPGPYDLNPGGRALLYVLGTLETLPRLLLRPWESWHRVRQPQGPSRIRSWLRTVSAVDAALYGLLLGALAVAIWLRVWFAFSDPSLPLHSAIPVLMATKGIRDQHLFAAGVRPDGLQAVIAAVGSLTGTPMLLADKWMGALLAIGLLVSICYGVWRLTGSALATVMSVTVFGTLYSVLPYDALFQTASVPSELVGCLILPAAVAGYESWHGLDPTWRWALLPLVGGAGLVSMAGLCDTTAAALAGALAGALVRGFHAGGFRRLRVEISAGWGIGILPVGIGALVSRHPEEILSRLWALGGHASTLQMTPVFLVACGSVILSLATTLTFRREGGRTRWIAPLTGLFLLLAAAGVEILARVRVPGGRLALTNDGPLLLALADILCLGLGAQAVFELASRAARSVGRWACLGAYLVGIAIAWQAWPLVPIRPYALQPASVYGFYDTLGSLGPDAGWAAVGDRSGEVLALDRGTFLTIGAFTREASTRPYWPELRTGTGVRPVPGKTLYLLIDRNLPASLPHVGFDTLMRRVVQRRALLGWLSRWEAAHGDLRPLERTLHLEVFAIHRPQGHSPARGLASEPGLPGGGRT